MGRRVRSLLPRRGAAGRGGFTLIELLVVMGIVTLFVGLMTPIVTTFLRNRTLDRVQGQFGGAFSRARLKAVTEGHDVSVVFFREGPRVYDDLNRVFEERSFSPGDSDLSVVDEEGNPELWYNLHCAGGKLSVTRPGEDPLEDEPLIPPYEEWEARQDRMRAAWRSQVGSIRDDQYDVRGLARVIFHRDGTLSFGPGMSDVRTAEFKKDVPRMADIAIYQRASPSVCFVDLRPTGQSRGKVVELPRMSVSPWATMDDGTSAEDQP